MLFYVQMSFAVLFSNVFVCTSCLCWTEMLCNEISFMMLWELGRQTNVVTTRTTNCYSWICFCQLFVFFVSLLPLNILANMKHSATPQLALSFNLLFCNDCGDQGMTWSNCCVVSLLEPRFILIIGTSCSFLRDTFISLFWHECVS